jgi:hypothetical protein
MTLFYHACIQSHLMYCLPIWGNLSKINGNNLYVLLKKAIRMIVDSTDTQEIKMSFTKMKIIKRKPFNYLFVYRSGIMTYKNLKQEGFYTTDASVISTRMARRGIVHIPTQRSYLFSRSTIIVQFRLLNWFENALKDIESLTLAKLYIRNELLKLYESDFNLDIILKGIYSN